MLSMLNKDCNVVRALRAVISHDGAVNKPSDSMLAGSGFAPGYLLIEWVSSLFWFLYHSPSKT